MDRNGPFVAIVLAAGRGERFGGGKLAAPLAGRPLLDHAVQTALASPAAQVIVVGRPGTQIFAEPLLRLIELHSAALSDSLRAGLAAAQGAAGAFIFLGDMPLVPPDVAARLVGAIGSAPAALPEWRGRPGHPVLLARRSFCLADGLAGDEGLGTVLRGLPGVVRLPVEEDGVVLDVDRVEDLAAIARRIDGY
ncbi:MAG: nucleotidyltransferase family protein [Novosphingobium sp.]